MSPSGSLADVGILELLHHDDRPTFVIESLSDGHNYITFRNAALDAFLAQNAGVIAFEDWTHNLDLSSKESAWNFAGRAWTSTSVGGVWTVFYCAQPPIIGTDENGYQKISQNLVVASSKSSASPSWNLLSHEPSESAKILDWTKYDVPDLSSFNQYIKHFDWASTPLGPIKKWPDQLSSFVISICTNPDPRVLVWGEDLTMIYNEACIPRLGERHPKAMGRSAADVYAEIWPQLVDVIKPVIIDGTAVKVTKELAFEERNGILEETYWNFIIFPLIGPSGSAIGAVDSFTELTQAVISQRRRDVVHKLNDIVLYSKTSTDVWSRCLEGLEPHPEDVPFAIIYSNDEDDSSVASSWSNHLPKKYRIHGTMGIERSNQALPESFNLSDEKSVYGLARACRDAWDVRRTVVLRRSDNTIPSELAVPIPGRGWGDSIEAVCVMPITPNGHGTSAFFIVGLNPRRPFNDESLHFAHNLRDVLTRCSSELSQQKFEEIHDNLSHQLKISTLTAARNEEKFTRMAESAPVGICTFLPDGKPLYINDEYLNLVHTPSKFDWKNLWDTGATWRAIIKPEDVPAIETAWKSLLEKEKSSVTVEYRLTLPWQSVDRATGSQLTGETWLMNKAVTELDENGNVLYIHAWLLDTSYQHYTESLQAQRLEEALETKGATLRFIDMVSHELRNPLSAILQSADGVLTTLEEPQNREGADIQTLDGVIEAAQTIVLCAQHQKCIVDDILTLSKLDSNLLVITPDRVKPPQLVDRVLKMFDAELHRAGIEARLKIESTYHDLLSRNDYVMLDPSRLLQVVINLLTNAIKFTQYAKERNLTVYLGASYERPTGDHHDLAFIEPRTSRHEHSTALSADWGNGQDIYLQLAVQDSGRGLSEEEISLLFQRFSQASPKTYKQYGGSGLGLFISRELTELQGGQIGVSSKGVGQGSTFAFYVRARQCAPDSSPVPESPVALQHVWNTPVGRSPLVYESTAQLPPTQSAFDTVEATPVKKREPSKLSTSTLATPPQPLHILVVEDNLINQKVMAQQLKRQGCVVHIANHGLEALTFLETSTFCLTTSTAPVALDIVLMDLEMPVMDGLTCIKEIRSRQVQGALKGHVPVIAVTANARQEQITVAKDAGMDSIVTKPFRIPDLVPQMRELVSKTAAKANRGTAAADKANAPVGLGF